jgi:hypothetical protein
MTDANRLLAFFRDNPNREICCTELVAGQFYGTKKIIEYTGRIKDARDILGCTCGEDKHSCTAPEHIVNVRKGFYKFITKVEVVAPTQEYFMFTLDEMQKKREELIKKYREAKAKDDKVMMKIIEIQGKAIRNAIDRERIKKSLF